MGLKKCLLARADCPFPNKAPYLITKNKMKKHLIFPLIAAAMTGLAFTSCNDEEEVTPVAQTAKYAVTLDLPLSVENPVLTAATATLTNVATKEKHTATNFRKADGQYADTLTLPVGTYNVDVQGTVSYTVDGTPVTSDVKASRENVSVLASDEGQSVTLALNTFRAQDGLVISEIFFTGTLTPEGKQYSDDQYFKIGNNSDSTIYLDGLAIVESAFLTVDKQSYTPDIMDRAMSVDAVYCIPGSGKEHPLAPGEETLIALNAKNHKEFNSQSMDLSAADFEFYDESENPSYTDEDNPNVPNMVNWYDYSASYFGLHNRGFKSYAIGRPSVDVETFMKDYLYTYTYVFTYGEYSFDMDGEAYKFPNEWIIDAVNLSIESDFQWTVTSAALDAGWTHCGSVDKDQSRYGKAVVRKKNGTKWVDTNNSTNDFEADASPTMLK